MLGSVLHFAHTLLVEGIHDALIQHRVEDLLLALSVQHTSEAGQGARRAAEPDWVLEVRKLVRQEAGGVLRGRPGQTFTSFVDTLAMDIGYDAKRRRLLMPRMMEGAVRILPLADASPCD